MSIAASRSVAGNELLDLAREATMALDALLADAVAAVRERVTVEGHVVGRLFDREQRATHGLAWLATYVEAVRQLAAYAERMQCRRHARRDRGTASSASASANISPRSSAAFR